MIRKEPPENLTHLRVTPCILHILNQSTEGRTTSVRKFQQQSVTPTQMLMFTGEHNVSFCTKPCVGFLNLLAPEFHIQILAHPVCKMRIIQEPKKVAL